MQSQVEQGQMPSFQVSMCCLEETNRQVYQLVLLRVTWLGVISTLKTNLNIMVIQFSQHF